MAAKKKMSPAQFERSGKDIDPKGMKEGSKADIARDIAEGLRSKPASTKAPAKAPAKSMYNFTKKKGK